MVKAVKKTIYRSRSRNFLNMTYRIDTMLLPPASHANHRWAGFHDDRLITVPKKNGSFWLFVYEPGSPTPIAQGIFAADDDVVRCDHIHVDEAHRRRGIASAIYKWASEVFRAHVVPSPVQLDLAKSFWGQREKIEYRRSLPAAINRMLTAAASGLRRIVNRRR